MMSYRTSDYDYSFPDELVAQEPLPKRDQSRMMVMSRQGGGREHRRFFELPELLQAGDLLVFNDAKVLPCRFFARKPTGGKLEVFFLRPLAGEWQALFSPARGLREGMELPLFDRTTGEDLPIKIQVTSLKPEDFRVRFHSTQNEEEIFTTHGEMPLPPYIRRALPRSEDRTRYQTIFASRLGAVAAPTAGLHFTEKTFSDLKKRGVQTASLTLYVGLGTFLPVKTEDIREHRMHEEFYEISNATQEKLHRCRKEKGRVIAVGTTALRALESWMSTDQAFGSTRLFIYPGFSFRCVQGLLTNFHQPKSTLLMLVSSLVGRESLLDAYHEAVDRGYRLFSYGDCMLVL